MLLLVPPWADASQPVAAPKPMAPRRAAGVWGQRAATYRPTAAKLAWLQEQLCAAQEQTAFENEGNAFFASVDLAQCVAEEMHGAGTHVPFEAEAAAAAAIAAASSSSRWEDNEAADSDAEEDLTLPFWAGVLPLQLAPCAPRPAGNLSGGLVVPEHVERWKAR